MRAVLATGNRGKAAELTRLLGFPVEAQPLAVEETGATFAANALLKARAARAAASFDVWGIGDDSGIAVDALDGEPGIHSARWTGPTDADRTAALLARLESQTDRRAAFICVLAAVSPDGRELFAEGRVSGTIATAPRGDGGFGYDPIFVPDGFDRTTAELTSAEKDAMSHRGRAVAELLQQLRQEP